MFCSLYEYTYITHSSNLMFYDKGSYATWGNFPSVEWILVNIIITTNCTDNILWLVDSWDFNLSIDHHLWTVWPVVKNLFMLKTKSWWIFKLWYSYLFHKTWGLEVPVMVEPEPREGVCRPSLRWPWPWPSRPSTAHDTDTTNTAIASNQETMPGEAIY